MRSNVKTALARWFYSSVVGCVVGALPTLVHTQPIGEEFQVNTTTVDQQQAPDVASDADGNFVVVFENFLPVTIANVGAQRYDSDGNPIGGEFQVNTTQSTDHTFPSVAMAADGTFVVAWQDFGDDGSGTGVFARRYNSNGQAQGSNFGVNTTTQGSQSRADVAMNDSGDFIVVWEDVTNGLANHVVQGQRYNALAVVQGAEFDISTDANTDHTYPKVAMDAAGNFVVGWSSGDVGADQNVVFRRYNASGQPQGLPVQVNVTTKMVHASGVVNNMSIDSDSQGNFVIAWRADNFSGPGVPGQSIGILGRRYTSSGTPLGGSFVVNTDNPSSAPEVRVLPNGEFAIVYEAPDGSLSGIFAVIYDSNGRRLGSARQYNTTTPLGQERPAIALDEEGGGIVVWRASNDQDGDRNGIFARLLRFTADISGGNSILRIICAVEGACEK